MFKKKQMNKFENKIIYWNNNGTINKLSHSICNDEISITSTDTILGFLGNITKASLENIIKIKGKREEKPFLVLIDSVEKLSHFIDSEIVNKNNNLKKLLKKYWPGPLTIIFNAKKNLPKFLKSKQNTIAIRCPKHTGLQSVLKNFNGLFSTSANKAGEKPVIKPNELKEEHTQSSRKASTGTASVEILNKIKYLVIDSKDKFDQTLPSTIIDITNNGLVKIIREGEISIKELEKSYGENFK